MNTSKTESVKGGNKQKNIREIYLESINQYQGSKKGGKVTSKNISNIKKGESTPTGSSSYLENEYTLVKKILTATKALEKLKTSGVSTDKSNPKGEPQSNTAKSSAAAFKYKTQEEYYAEILEQKKLVKHLQNNEVISKAKLEYYDNELARKEQEILNLLDFKKDEASTSVRDESINLKIKAYKLEFSLKRKDAELTKLKSDLKTTDMKELKSQNERLRNELSKALMNDQKILEAQEVRGISFKDGKLVYQLEDQNDQTKSEVKQNIAKRLQKGQLYEANGPVIKLGDFKNKITLFGSLKDKLELLDERETELLVEISRLNKQIIRGKKNLDSRGSSRDKSPNDSSKMNAVKVLQSIMKGHLERSRSLSSYEKEKLNQVRKRSPSRSKSPRIHQSKSSLRHESPRFEDHGRRSDRSELQDDYNHRRPNSKMSNSGSILKNSNRSHHNYSQTDSFSSSDDNNSREDLIENKKVVETKSGLCCSPWRSFV